ncbi:MAG TPA: hypothetical protein VKH19_02020 [Gemmatimonadaceae bacterium]|nr:hypothetical protein [Gemmatimonadaceae bacterium]
MLKGRLVLTAPPARKVRLDLQVQPERREQPVLMVQLAPPALRVRLVLMALPVRLARRV